MSVFSEIVVRYNVTAADIDMFKTVKEEVDFEKAEGEAFLAGFTGKGR